MFTKEAYEALTERHAIAAADQVISNAALSGNGLVVLPTDFAVHDLERVLPYRRRARGAMVTNLLGDYAVYVKTQKDKVAAAVFVDKSRMAAKAVLNLGCAKVPGHADDTAELVLQPTAAYKALQAIVRAPAGQVAIAEFLEDWGSSIGCCYDFEDEVEPLNFVRGTQQAVVAVRRITIESARKVETEHKSLEASASTFDQVKVANAIKLPSRIAFTCMPFVGLSERTFLMRLSVLTGETAPKLQLRVIQQEQHEEDMAEEMANLVREELTDVPVYVGTYAPNK